MRALLLTLLFVLAQQTTTLAPEISGFSQTFSPPEVSFTPGSWTLVVLPDTQSYVDNTQHLPILYTMMDWILAQREALNIKLVLQEGDVVYQNAILLPSQGTGDQNGAQQWANARRAFAKLDGVLPYIIAPGNHDYGIGNADSRQTQFNSYFAPTDNPLVDFTYGGILAELGPNALGESTLENAAYDFTAPDGRKLLVLALEFGPRQAAVDWADEVAGRDKYRGHTKLLLTHAYLYHDGTRYDWAAKGKDQANNPYDYQGTSADTNDGEDLWNELVRKHSGFELVLCGHVGGDMVDYLASTNDAGQNVHQMLFNAQFLPQGWLRLLEFLPDGKTVHVRTYSPYFDQDGDPATSPWRNGGADDFSFELSPVAR